MESSAVKDLFGGAITVSLPFDLIDASDLRQVPDNQEVFLYPDSNISIIVEILERVDPADFSEAVKFHFDSLAHDNAAISSDVQNITIIQSNRGDDTPSPIVLIGVQQIKKFNRPTPDEVRILMALFRLEAKNIDLVVTVNVPMKSEDGEAVGEEGWHVTKTGFNNLIRSLRIVDFGLFV